MFACAAARKYVLSLYLSRSVALSLCLSLSFSLSLYPSISIHLPPYLAPPLAASPSSPLSPSLSPPPPLPPLSSLSLSLLLSPLSLFNKEYNCPDCMLCDSMAVAKGSQLPETSRCARVTALTLICAKRCGVAHFQPS